MHPTCSNISTMGCEDGNHFSDEDTEGLEVWIFQNQRLVSGRCRPLTVELLLGHEPHALRHA
jgi:hypothetical protein